MQLPDGFTIRPPRPEDGVPLVAMMNREELALTGRITTSLEWVVTPWTAPGARLERDYAIVVDRDGQPAGYLMLDAHEPYTRIFAVGAVALPLHGRGVGAAVLGEIERRARALAELAPAGEQVLLNVGSLADEPRVAGLLTAHGYREVRRFWVMTIAFGADPPDPELPPGYELRAVELEHMDAVYDCLADAFRDHFGDFEPRERWLHGHVTTDSFDPGLWRVAWHDGCVAGALVAVAESTDDPSLGSVDLLGVRRDERGRGLGEALLRSAFAALAARGSQGATLLVDSESPTGATRLYERVGMTARPSYVTWEKLVRDFGPVA
jgi:GNAT superfamily N-acetyltransferase